MGNDAAKNPVGTAYINDVFMRHPLTKRNQEELDIASKVTSILKQHEAKNVLKLIPKGGKVAISPTGFSLNDVRYGDFPLDEPTALARGWRAYMNMGVPVVEEISDITQPPPDVISKQTYINGTDPIKVIATDTVEFSISNTISWSLQGELKLTFGAKSTASLQQQLQKSMEMMQYQQVTLLNSKDNQGVNTETHTEVTSSTSASSSVTGTGELWGELLLGITGSVSGSLTTAWRHQSSVTVELGSRVDVLATSRRQVRKFDYQFPVTFGGWVALYYPEPVEVKESPPQAKDPKYSKVIAWKLGDASGNFDLADEGKKYMQKGILETVAVRVGEHRVFQPEKLDFSTQKQAL